LTKGLRAAGCEVVPVDVEFPGAGALARLLRMSWADQATSRAFAAAFGATAKRRLGALAGVDGVVTIGSAYSLSTDLDQVTFEDMTVAQALRQPDPDYTSLSERGAARWKDRQRRNYERSAACCVASEWAGASVREDYGVPAAKVRVVGLGTNIEIAPLERDWKIPRFLFVGIDWERKRGPAVVNAFSELRQSFPEATLDLVGLHPKVEQAGVVEHGMLPLDSPAGQQKYVGLLARSTCLLMPSTFEPFGIAYLDAAVAGTPSIGTTVGGAADAVGEGGVVVDPSDPAALLAAMLELADPETARRLGERAQSRRADITWAAVARRVLDALFPDRERIG
jgi:glycosyltransferase involved in cell wall biosynthesis